MFYLIFAGFDRKVNKTIFDICDSRNKLFVQLKNVTNLIEKTLVPNRLLYDIF